VHSKVASWKICSCPTTTQKKKKKKQQLGDSVLPLILGQRGLSTSICIHLASTSDSFGIEEKSK
jgi:hypothetical protein